MRGILNVPSQIPKFAPPLPPLCRSDGASRRCRLKSCRRTCSDRGNCYPHPAATVTIGRLSEAKVWTLNEASDRESSSPAWILQLVHLAQPGDKVRIRGKAGSTEPLQRILRCESSSVLSVLWTMIFRMGLPRTTPSAAEGARYHLSELKLPSYSDSACRIDPSHCKSGDICTCHTAEAVSASSGPPPPD